VLGGSVTADRTALRRVTGIGGREWDDEYVAGDLGHHQPVGWWYCWIEEWFGSPRFVHVVDPERSVLEQVGGLGVDLEWVVLVKLVEVEQHRSEV